MKSLTDYAKALNEGLVDEECSFGSCLSALTSRMRFNVVVKLRIMKRSISDSELIYNRPPSATSIPLMEVSMSCLMQRVH